MARQGRRGDPQGLRRTVRRRGIVQPPRSRAFFLELLLSMLIFALCSTVILQIFVQSKLVTDESVALSALTIDARSVAETYKVRDGGLLEVADTALGVGFERELSEEGALVCYYDDDLEPVNDEDARYRLVLTPVESVSTLVGVLEIAAYDGEKELFIFEVYHYQPEWRR